MKKTKKLFSNVLLAFIAIWLYTYAVYLFEEGRTTIHVHTETQRQTIYVTYESYFDWIVGKPTISTSPVRIVTPNFDSNELSLDEWGTDTHDIHSAIEKPEMNE